jgi:hypothetical protein
MVKIIYAGLLILSSAALFLFSKSKPAKNCKYQLEGVVKEMKDSTGLFLYIETPDKKTFYPRIDNEDVILSSGSKVKVCYDTLQTLSSQALIIRLNDVTYLP